MLFGLRKLGKAGGICFQLKSKVSLFHAGKHFHINGVVISAIACFLF